MAWALYLLGSFVAAVIGSYALTHLVLRPRRSVLPAVGTTLRLRAHSGVYRSKLMVAHEGLWRISTPLQRNHYVPLRQGEPITIEAPVSGGVYLFRTKVAECNSDDNELSILVPPLARPTERRQEPRKLRNDSITIDDAPGMLVDLSRNGARLRSSCRVRLGDRVKLRLPEGMVVGWVIDAWPGKPSDAFADVLRVRFETPLP